MGSTLMNVFTFLSNHKNENFQYLLGKSNYILYLLDNIIKKIFKLFKLDIQLEHWYSFFYIFSKIILFIIFF